MNPQSNLAGSGVDLPPSLPCPSPSLAQSGRKRKSDLLSTSLSPPLKHRCLNTERDYSIESEENINPIEYWATYSRWPKGYQFGAMDNASQKPKTTQSESSGSNLRAARRIESLKGFGIYDNARITISPVSREFCRNLLDERVTEIPRTVVPPEMFQELSYRADAHNESRVHRDISPWVVPSLEHSYLCGEKNLQPYTEELNTDWTQCMTMGSTRPRPDITIGLSRDAFSEDELKRLQQYKTLTGPINVTPFLYFPFLVCEVKSGDQTLKQADVQNLHSAAIAVNSIFKLYEKAYGWKSPEMLKDLHHQVLVFSVSHNAREAYLYAHFGVCEEDPLKSPRITVHRHLIRACYLVKDNDCPDLMAYNFVRNIYDFFAPQHLKRIQTAIGLLQQPSAPVLASDIQTVDSLQENSEEMSEDSRGQKRPRLHQRPSVASVTTNNQLTQLSNQIRQQEEQMKQKEEQMKQKEEQMKQQEEQMKQQEEQMKQQEEQMKQQQEQMKQQQEQWAQERERTERMAQEQMGRMERMLQQQHEQMKQQQEQIARLVAQLSGQQTR